MPSTYLIKSVTGQVLHTFPQAATPLVLSMCGPPAGSRYVMHVDGDPTKEVPLEVYAGDTWTPFEPALGPQQQIAYEAALAGFTCLITGPGGVGKSELVRRIVRDIRRSGRKVAVTASTGVAAVNIRGMTIHSTLGTGQCRNRAEQQKRYSSELSMKVETRLGDVDVIVLDEVSMLTGDYIDMMDWWLRLVMGEDRPYAGKQVIFVGDFLQLPPVVHGSERVNKRFAFQSEIWAAAPPEIFYLRKGYRQADADFRKHLMRVRKGIAPEDTLAYFNARRDVTFAEGVTPTKLMALNREVDDVNYREYRKLTTPETSYQAVYAGHPNWIEALKNNLPCDDLLDLKVGAEVVFIKNNRDQLYVNGTRGVVEDLDGHIVVRGRDGNAYEAVREEWSLTNADGDDLATVVQFPLRLAWAMTIHKAQGATLDDLEINPSSIFEKGQCYVALSRVRSIGGLRLASRLEERHIMAHPVVVDWYAEILERERANAGA